MASLGRPISPLVGGVGRPLLWAGMAAAGRGCGRRGFAEPVYAPPTNWLDGGGTLADHPLLRGLLLELPTKGSEPPPGWLDRWFEAARCILELLYMQESRTH